MAQRATQHGTAWPRRVAALVALCCHACTLVAEVRHALCCCGLRSVNPWPQAPSQRLPRCSWQDLQLLDAPSFFRGGREPQFPVRLVEVAALAHRCAKRLPS